MHGRRIMDFMDGEGGRIGDVLGGLVMEAGMGLYRLVVKY